MKNLLHCLPRRTISVMALGIVLIAGCNMPQKNSSARREFTVCMDEVEVKHQCDIAVKFSVLEEASPGAPKGKYYADANFPNHGFAVYIPASERVLEFFKENIASIEVNPAFETMAVRFERYYRIATLRPTSLKLNRDDGSLIAVAESPPNEMGSELLLPASGEKAVFLQCAKPYYAEAGHLVTDLGCTVHSQIHPYVFIRYQIERRYRHEWKSINDEVLQQLESAMTITESNKYDSSLGIKKNQ